MSKLFEPISIAGVSFPNRVVMPPMATDMAEADGSVSPRNVAYYRRAAGAGMGLLVIEHNYITVEGKVSGRQMSIARDEDVIGHQALLAAIHEAGVLAALQINHSGSNRMAPLHQSAVGASPVPHPTAQVMPRELDISEIADLVKQFGRAAGRAKTAGYDLIEIHCAHGYLLNQFLSPLTNQRQDRYGGPIENRLRLLLETVREVQGVVGNAFPLMVRLGVSDNPPGKNLFSDGLPVEDGVEAAKALEKMGIAILDISAGMCGSRPAGITGEAYFQEFARAARQSVNLPLILTGGITAPETAERILQSGLADLVGVGRALAANTNWIHNARKKPAGSS